MRLIVVDSAIKARTLWRILGDPEGTVVVPVRDDLVGLNVRTPFDSSNNFAPIYGVNDERAWQALMRRAKSAESILIGINDAWQVNVMNDMLRGHGLMMPINSLMLPDMSAETVRRALASPGPAKSNPEAVERGWRRRLMDRIVGDPIGKAVKKLVSVDWKPTFNDVTVLLRAARMHHFDNQDLDEGGTVEDIEIVCDVNFPDFVASRLNHQHPAETLVHIDEMIGHGLLVNVTDEYVSNLRKYCEKMFPGLVVVPYKDIDRDQLVPADIAMDVVDIPALYRPIYMDIWNQTIGFVTSRIPKVFRTELYASTGNLCASVEDVQSLGHLRSSWLLHGRSYTVVSEIGLLVAAMIRNTWPRLNCLEATSAITQGIETVEIDRDRITSAVSDLMASQRAFEVPPSMSLCWSCRSPLNVTVSQRRVRLVCQRSMCAKAYAVGHIDRTVEPLFDSLTARWCNLCSKIRAHDVTSENSNITRTCKGCGHSSQEQ